ncbi:hypothetical protein HNQ50_000125 [Silvimonas terrae]|uniref:Lipoprotein n=1 Tax=Silvimonas terrae TaxID=300266 RepID=A0A840R801_9NEIS|nr:hypothetical protein [Silvimonas terrae]MBB5189415.1 hypothetical protein [Silvimonas terrae]
MAASSALCLLAACSSFSSSMYSETAVAGAGVAGAAVAAKVTTNATVATGIGLIAVAGARQGVQYSQRTLHRDQQLNIAAVAGPLKPGAVAPWTWSPSVPLEPAADGRVTVSRIVSSGELNCKEIVFSVIEHDTGVTSPEAFYVSTICKTATRWEWAAAEPATGRWGSLQ